MLKQSLALLLSFLLVFGLAACGTKTELEEDITAALSSIDLSLMVSEEETEDGESLAEEKTSSVAEIPSEAVTSVETETASTLAVQAASSVASSKTESMASTAKDTAVSSAESVYEMSPVDNFNGDTVDELIDWLRSQQSLASSSVLQPGDAAVNGVGSSTAQQSILVPQAVNEDLSSYGITVPKDSDTYIYDFRTYESEVINENQLYTISVKPLTEEDKAKKLIDLYYPNKEKHTDIYNGIPYAYKDGDEGTSQATRSFAAAWFIQDGYVVKISAYWCNSFKPWNTDYFDYFDFETVTF